ncbi:MAG TPA: MarR family transcriptional regulator [Burkholderiaceae bacterium]|nr:MarR family transcriptional regulator [Burkholderiaceae bacterium]
MASNDPKTKFHRAISRKRVRRSAANTGGLRIPPGGRTHGRDARRELALAVLEQFRLIFRSAKKHFQWVEERTGVSGAQLWVLAEVQRRPGIRVTELAHAMAVHQSTVSNLLDRLERHGLLQRDRSSADQRVVHLSLTELGRSTIARAPLPLEGVLPDALNRLAHGELVDLQQRLEQLAKLMKVRDSRGKRIPLAEM